MGASFRGMGQDSHLHSSWEGVSLPPRIVLMISLDDHALGDGLQARRESHLGSIR